MGGVEGRDRAKGDISGSQLGWCFPQGGISYKAGDILGCHNEEEGGITGIYEEGSQKC